METDLSNSFTVTTHNHSISVLLFEINQISLHPPQL